MADYITLYNRIKKNLKRINKLNKLNPTDAYRFYHLDIPEFPYIIDNYAGHVIVWEKGKHSTDPNDQLMFQQKKAELIKMLHEIFSGQLIQIHYKNRKIMDRKNQYHKLNVDSNLVKVNEDGITYLINPAQYLDVGLFLDHRPLRKFLQKLQPRTSVLNLFCYTGSLSVAAAKAGAIVDSIDLSNTYLNWAKLNFKTNQLSLAHHQFIRADIVQWLNENVEKSYDLIILDPPSFSTSKKMISTFDVERDQKLLIHQCFKRLNPNGTIIFSNNKHKFKLDAELKKEYNIAETTYKTLDKNYPDQKAHKSFEIKKGG
jgi:23S rRNA (cytosine1962-C5)-methyltransferase/23S rRNA (guanine2445-N2)-methyltransferase / 23S rRNA (guanine2069-N7)-methyltransferase